MKKTTAFCASIFLLSVTTPVIAMDCCLGFLCCKSKKKQVKEPTKNAHRIEAIRVELINAQRTNPAALRELYLKCLLPEYEFSPDSGDYLESQLLIDHESTLREEDRQIILSLLMPNEFCLDASDWHYYQRVVDFTLRYSSEAAQIRKKMEGKSQDAIPESTLKILHETYNLIISGQSISELEIRRIAEMMPTDSTPIERFNFAPIPFSVKLREPISIMASDEE